MLFASQSDPNGWPHSFTPINRPKATNIRSFSMFSSHLLQISIINSDAGPYPFISLILIGSSKLHRITGLGSEWDPALSNMPSPSENSLGCLTNFTTVLAPLTSRLAVSSFYYHLYSDILESASSVLGFHIAVELRKPHLFDFLFFSMLRNVCLPSIHF